MEWYTLDDTAKAGDKKAKERQAQIAAEANNIRESQRNISSGGSNKPPTPSPTPTVQPKPTIPSDVSSKPSVARTIRSY